MAEKGSMLAADNYLFPKIFRSFSMAVQPSKLLIALSGLAVVCLSGWLMDLSRTVVVLKDSSGQITSSELRVYLENPDGLDNFIESFGKKKMPRGQQPRRAGVFSTLWHFAAGQFHAVMTSLLEFKLPEVVEGITRYFRAFAWAVKYHTLYCIIFYFITLAVVSFCGGAICRLAALQFAQGEKPGLFEALRFARKNFHSFFAAPLGPLGIILCIGAFIFLLGLTANIPWVGEVILALFSPLALLAGTLVAIITIAAVAGFNLMFPAIAYEDTDFFDSISRSFNYVLSKPWHMGFYTLVAAIYGAICYLFVRLFAFVLLLSTRAFIHLGLWMPSSSEQTDKLTAVWPEPQFLDLSGTPVIGELNWTESFAAFVIHMAVLVVVGLVVSFVISFFFSANTIVYAMMRKLVDNTPVEKIHTHLDEVKNGSSAKKLMSEDNLLT